VYPSEAERRELVREGEAFAEEDLRGAGRG
jgi:hypothetical protein